MKQLRYVSRSLTLRVLVSTLGGVTVGAVGSQLVVVLAGESLQARYVLPDTLWLISFGCLVAGPLVLAYGLPIYLLLRRFNAANFGTALMVGSLPGLAALLHSADRIAVMAFCSGVAIAGIFQILTQRLEKSA